MLNLKQILGLLILDIEAITLYFLNNYSYITKKLLTLNEYF
jgi:hypothetical protein